MGIWQMCSRDCNFSQSTRFGCHRDVGFRQGQGCREAICHGETRTPSVPCKKNGPPASCMKEQPCRMLFASNRASGVYVQPSPHTAKLLKMRLDRIFYRC